MNNEQIINRLFLTNNYSIVSKYSAVKLGYFEDKILEEFIENYFAGKSWRRTPLVNRGYGARLLAFDSIVNHFISTKSVDCFIVLGAGYDTLPFRATNANCCFIELDLPQVVDVKSKFIRDKKVLKNEDLNQFEPGRYSSSGLMYHLVACDLRDSDGLLDILRSIISNMADFHICPENFAIINEVCLCYLETSEISSILKAVIESVKDSANKVHYIGYEQVKPDKDSQFNSIILDHFRSIGHPIKHYPNSRQVHWLLTDDLKFSQVKIESMHKVFHTDLLFPRSHHKGYVDEPFDEYEEMDLYLSHYALISGTLHLKANSDSRPSGRNIELAYRFASDQGDQLNANNLDTCERQASLVRSDVQRFGHSSCLMNVDDSGVCSILSSGGFGKSQASSSLCNINRQHKRLSDSFLLSIDSNKSCSVKSVDISDVVSKSICMDRMHGQCCELSDNILFFNGGRQGPARFNSSNVPFLANLVDGTQLIVKHPFKSEESTLKWRHKVTNLDDAELLQVGGKMISNGSCGGGYNSVVIWNMSSDKLGSYHCKTSSQDDTMFLRHSFGMDKRDSKTVLLFGGLSPSNLPHNDLPIDKSQAALIWDLRTKEPARLAIESAQCYGANVHFISDNQFVKIGGISTLDGLANGIEMFDLRQIGQFSVENVPLPVDVDGKTIILTNTTTCHLKNERKIITLGGGGNYFTFGTHFNKHNLVYRY